MPHQKLSRQELTNKIAAIVMENFLTEEESAELVKYFIENEANFKSKAMIESGSQGFGEQIGQAKAMNLLGSFKDMLVDRIKRNLGKVIYRMNSEPFPVGEIDIQVTASGDREYFRVHRDSSEPDDREITFAYHLFREPQRFSGGELKIYEIDRLSGHITRQQTIAARHNTAIFFPSRYGYEKLPTEVLSKKLADSCFSIIAWVHRGKLP